MKNIHNDDFPVRQVGRLFRAIMDPKLFEGDDISLKIVKKLSTDFEEELDACFLVDNTSSKLLREGILNINVDTRIQKEAFLVANFGFDLDTTDVIPIERFQGMSLMDTLSKAKDELEISRPPIPTLQCSYKEYDKVLSRRSKVTVSPKNKRYNLS